jgi:DNA invertase Pin-like site-specific DNA recombinase
METTNNAVTAKPRIVLLYRASSKKQTDSENDIPLQRNILKPWAEKQGYEFICEKVEGGVSGFKVHAADRDALNEIKAMADRREFDILGIYNSDRLGRIAAETPLVVEYLNAREIKVISYTEGEISANTHVDKLMTYIRYWQAQGESMKTAMRVSDASEQSVRLGKWRGGNPPYGYRVVSRGALNFKGRPIFDVEIHPEQAEAVKTIFRLYTKENYGTKSIAKYLNDREIKTNRDNYWNNQVIGIVLRNRLYTGYYDLHSRTKDKPVVSSPLMPQLVIISEEEYAEAQGILKRNKRGGMQRPTVHGAQLLTGLLYCGECGRKFTSLHAQSKRTNPSGKTYEYDEHKYRCTSFYIPKERGTKCHQKIYKAAYLEDAVIKGAKKFVTELDKAKLLKSHNDTMITALKEAEERTRKTARERLQAEKELGKLKDEVIRALLGESAFDKNLLNDMIKKKEAELLDLTEKAEIAKNVEEELQVEYNSQKEMTEELDTWVERFDRQSTTEKKSMLINLIDRITVYPENLEVEYKIKASALPCIQPIDMDNNGKMAEFGIMPPSLSAHYVKGSTQATPIIYPTTRVRSRLSRKRSRTRAI